MNQPIRTLWYCPLKATVTLVFALLPLLTSTPATAGPRTARENAARKACLKGDYAKGVDILVDLFVETKDPTYLFNQGRCLEQNRQFKDAIGRFEEYLRSAGAKLSAEDSASAEKHIADCKASLAEERETPLQPAPVPASPIPPPPAPEPTPAATIAEQPAPPPAPAPTERRWGLLTAGIVTGAVGVGAIVTGVVLNLKVNQMSSDMEDKPGNWSSGKESDQKTYRAISMIGYGAGAACVVAGAIMIGLGSRHATNSSDQVAFVPTLGAGQVGAMLTGAF